MYVSNPRCYGHPREDRQQVHVKAEAWRTIIVLGLLVAAALLAGTIDYQDAAKMETDVPGHTVGWQTGVLD